jgi:hypothetical protein
MSRVELDNGEGVFVFNPIAVGDVVEAKENNGYKNWAKKRVDPRNEANDQFQKYVLAYLKDIRARLARLEGEPEQDTTLPQKPAVAPSTQPTSPLEQRVRETFLNKPDTIAPMNPNDEVDLNDIPY